MSLIFLNDGDQWDKNINQFLSGLDLGEKFDINDIKTKTITIKKDRAVALSQEDANVIMATSGVAKEVMAYIFNRKDDGSMDAKLLQSRGLYNAKDQDILNAAVAKVNEQYLEWGEKLVQGSYIVLVDFNNFKENRSKDNSSVTYDTEARAYAYKIDCPREKLDEFYATAWADPNSSDAAKAAARKGFDNFNIDLIPVAAVSGTSFGTASIISSVTSLVSMQGNPNRTPEGAAELAYNNAFTKLENAIPAWQVAVSIISKHPLKAKIGKKEGVKNTQRFRSYSYTEDEEGNLVSKPGGYLRAVEVADNKGVATGESATTTFYQISGLANIDERWTIKQSNDLKLGVGLEPKLGGFSRFSINVGFDYLIRMWNGGHSLYGLANFGTDPLAEMHNGVAAFNLIFGGGVGYGLKLTRMFELAPYAMVGADSYIVNKNSNPSGSSTAALYIEPGVRFSVNFYPLSIYAKGCYDILIGANEYNFYGVYNSNLKHPHKSGLGASVGVKWAF